MERRVDHRRMAANLKQLRKRSGLSQTELAERSGVSQPTISALERAAHDGVKTNTLAAIADVLGICPVCLQCEDATPDLLLDGSLCEIQTRFCQATPEGRQFLLQAARRETR